MIGLLFIAQIATATPDMGAPVEPLEHKVERLRAELRKAELEVVAARVNAQAKRKGHRQ